MLEQEMSDRGVAVVSDRTGTSVVEFWRPMIWSAIVGGAVAALGIQLIFTLFGVGIGAAMVDPATDPAGTADGVGVGAALWLILSGIVSFGAGGFIAGAMSGVTRSGGGALHGVLAWALAAVFGGTIAAMAGSTTFGGAAAGIGAATSADWRTRSTVLTTPADRVFNPTLQPEDRGTITEAEARAAAERTAEAIASAAFVTGGAFLLSMIAAGVGGTLARKDLKFMARRRPGPVGRAKVA